MFSQPSAKKKHNISTSRPLVSTSITLSRVCHSRGDTLPEEEHDTLEEIPEIVVSLDGLLGVKDDVAKDLGTHIQGTKYGRKTT